ncbi:MAG: 4'-phosphopantetheinyl transferase superfamily protein [Bacteroidetes bacterium]|nr:4'-phosphopantetheinyl transferase superfamily protein [Bacteroidota bacterium]
MDFLTSLNSRIIVSDISYDITNDFLSLEEREDFKTITNKKRAIEWLSTRYIIKKLYPSAFISYGKNGEPLLNSCPEYKNISISHGAEKIALIFSNNNCGIDIDSPNRNFDKVANLVLNIKERAIISEKDHGKAWCSKESIYKFYKGKNISFLKDIVITDIDAKHLKISCKKHTHEVSIEENERYILAYLDK